MKRTRVDLAAAEREGLIGAPICDGPTRSNAGLGLVVGALTTEWGVGRVSIPLGINACRQRAGCFDTTAAEGRGHA
jgi:hypothetical protein